MGLAAAFPDVGIGLLGWVIHGAVTGEAREGWGKLRDADGWLIAALLGCTVVSAICNGTTFWVTIQPIRAVRWHDMQLLNLVANMLNYAPVRLGALLRILYHLRVDRLTIIQIGAWFAMIGAILFLGVGAALLATLIRSTVDWLWLAIVVGQMIVGVGAMRLAAGFPLFVKHARGIDKMVVLGNGVWWATVLRIVDLAAYVGRMAAAMAMLQLHLPASQIVQLAMVALAASLMPVGKVGFREFCVAAVATRLNMQAEEVKGTWEQLALIESAGEAIVFIPLGAISMLWFRSKWAKARQDYNMTPSALATGTNQGD